MLETLKFVQGAVAKKDFLPELTHFVIENGRVQGFNGALGLSSPINCPLNVKPRAVPFVKALMACRAEVKIGLTPTGRLSIKSGAFKAFIDCHTDEVAKLSPEGETVQLNGNLLAVLKKLAPFISEDASRPWSRGIYINGKSAYVTNNIILCEYWLGYTFPRPINIPRMAVTELLRIGKEPVNLQTDGNSATFHYEGGRWLRTQLVVAEYPDFSSILTGQANLDPIPEGLFDAVETVTPFADDLGRIFLGDELVATSRVEGDGASVAVEGVHADGCYHSKYLMMLKGFATKMDFHAYPKPCHFVGDKVRGVIGGLRY